MICAIPLLIRAHSSYTHLRLQTTTANAFSSLQNDIVTARTLAHLARVCATRGKVDVAVPMYRRIVCIHEALPQPSNSDHAVALCELATLLEESGSQEDAAGLLRRKADVIMGELSARMEAAEPVSYTHLTLPTIYSV